MVCKQLVAFQIRFHVVKNICKRFSFDLCTTIHRYGLQAISGFPNTVSRGEKHLQGDSIELLI